MPELKGVTLPVITPPDMKELDAMIARDKLSPEAYLELVIYLQREIGKLDGISATLNTLRAKLSDYYAGLAEDKRETVRTPAGQLTYSAASDKVEIIDRDATVASLSEEQLRISYIPDVAALKTILKKDHFDRITRVVPGRKASITIKDLKGPYEEF